MHYCSSVHLYIDPNTDFITFYIISKLVKSYKLYALGLDSPDGHPSGQTDQVGTDPDPRLVVEDVKV